MAKEKEKVIVIAGCDSMAKVVAIAIAKYDFSIVLEYGRCKVKSEAYKRIYNESIENENEEFSELPDKVRKYDNFYKRIHEPINSKPFKYSQKFDRTARNAI